MGREIRRVPLDFAHPAGQVWPGFVLPDHLREEPCPCGDGLSPRARLLRDQWQGHIPFWPSETGSTAFAADSPAVQAAARQMLTSSPQRDDPAAVARRAEWLAELVNSQWCYHLAQEDVDALIAEDRLRVFTRHRRTPHGWEPKQPPVRPTAAEVNAWAVAGEGHDDYNMHVVIRARCEREGMPYTCQQCQGRATVEAWPGQRAEAEQWKPTPPPTGDGWQLWETTTEGSPISPVFATAEELAEWMAHPDRGDERVPVEVARRFVEAGWAPTFVGVPGVGLVDGVVFVGSQQGD